MKLARLWFSAVAICILAGPSAAADHFHIGWASVDITPDRPVAMRGSTVSAGVIDPITATALAMEYVSGRASEKVIMISCDLQHITDGSRYDANMLGNVRTMLQTFVPELRPEQIIMMATHTHVGPSVQSDREYNLFASETG